MKKIILSAIVVTGLLFAGCNQTSKKETASKGVSYEKIADKLTPTEFRKYGETSPTTVSTRLGDLNFTDGGFGGGYPTLETSERLKAELDFQKACQAYLWAVPLVSYYNWFDEHKKFGARDGAIVHYVSAEAKQGILTGNGTTPYALVFADLMNTGPLVLDVPPGAAAGVVDDMFQRQVYDFGVSGPERGKGTKLIIIAPGMEAPKGYDKKKFIIVQNTTRDVFIGIRALQPKPADADAFLRKFNIYPYSERNNNPVTQFVEVDGKTPWGQWQDHGMAYWETVKRIVDHDIFSEREGYILAMLQSLGIEKGKPWNPTPEQKKLFKEAAVVGESMVKSITFDKPFRKEDLYKGTNWDRLMIPAYNDKDGDIEQMYKRAAFTWEAVSRGKAYYMEVPGLGQAYRTGYKDADGNHLLGSKHYTLTLAPNPPAKTFWSVVVYDVNTRTMIINKSKNPMVSGRRNPHLEADGSIIMHFSPEKPEGVEDNNWVQTNPKESWFTYLRFYGPTKEYFDETYPLQDIKLVK
ncbi:MAG: DUF1214 domain-containing protein [Bacteroidales bacterium]|nr:DUF1214 domain-containing protein [Bacteroidales bacterium]